MRNRSLILMCLVALPLCAGCYPEPQAAVSGEVTYEGEPPPEPAAQVEVVAPSPGPEFVWVGGYHRWTGRGYVWVGGHYERRPHPGAVWAAAHWEVRGRAHVWVEGRWR